MSFTSTEAVEFCRDSSLEKRRCCGTPKSEFIAPCLGFRSTPRKKSAPHQHPPSTRATRLNWAEYARKLPSKPGGQALLYLFERMVAQDKTHTRVTWPRHEATSRDACWVCQAQSTLVVAFPTIGAIAEGKVGCEMVEIRTDAYATGNPKPFSALPHVSLWVQRRVGAASQHARTKLEASGARAPTVIISQFGGETDVEANRLLCSKKSSVL